MRLRATIRVFVLVLLLLVGSSIQKLHAATRILDPGADLAVAVQEAADGDVIGLKPGRYSGGAIADKKRLSIVGAASGETVIVPGPSNLVFGSVNGGELTLRALVVETSAEAPWGLFAQGGSILCDGCTVRASGKGAVYVEAGTLELVNTAVNVPVGEAVLALSGSTVRLNAVNLRSEAGSAFAAQEATEVVIKGSTLSGVEGALITGASAHIVIDHTQIIGSSTESHALDLRIGGKLQLTEVQLRGGKYGLVAVLEPASVLNLKSGTASGGIGGLYFEQKSAGEAARVSIVETFAIASGNGDESIALRTTGPLSVAVSESDLYSGGAVAVAVAEGAQLSVDGSTLIAARAGAAALGEVPGRIEFKGTLVVAPTVTEYADSTVDAETQKLGQIVQRDAALMQEFVTAVVEAAKSGETREVHRLADRVRSAATEIATLEFQIVDGAGRSMSLPFALTDLNGKPVAESVDGKQIAVAPGSYVVEAKGDASLATDVDIVAGQATTAQINAPDALWLDINRQKDGPNRIVLFRTVPEGDMRTALRAIEPTHAYSNRTGYRSGANEQDLQKAIEAARRLIALNLVFPKDGTDEAKQSFGTWESTVYDWALPALAIAGTAVDVDVIAKGLDRPVTSFYVQYRWLGYLAYIENRLGHLAEGRIALLSEKSENLPVAAHSLRLMDYYGVPKTREKLLSLMTDSARFDTLPTFLRDEIADIGASQNWPEFPALASKWLANASEKARVGRPNERGLFEDSTVAAAVYLLVFGTSDEKRLITDELFMSHASRWNLTNRLARIAADPTPFFEEFEEDEYGGGVSQSEYLCPSFRLRGEEAFNRIVDGIIDAAARRGAATAPYAAVPRQAYHTADLTRRVMLGACRPDSFIAEAFYTDLVRPAEHGIPGNWYPAFLSVEPLLDFVGKKPGFKGPVEASPVEVVLGAWDRMTDPQWIDYKEERMALFRAFTKAGDVQSNSGVNDGIERRVYVLRHVVEGRYSGAISGHVEVRPEIDEGKLAIGIRLKQAPYYWSFGELGTHIETGGDLNHWLHQPYVIDGGRKLIEKIVLKRGSEPIPLREEKPDADGYFRFATDVNANDLSQLVLTVDVALFDDRRSLWFDLYASGFARHRSGQ